jgi:hypothetical protein
MNFFATSGVELTVRYLCVQMSDEVTASPQEFLPVGLVSTINREPVVKQPEQPFSKAVA